MRFIRRELSPANKRQYLIALGRRDIELLLGEAKQAYRYMPETASLKQDRQRLTGIIRGLTDALRQATADGDDYERVPIKDRQEYKNHKEKHPLTDITRLELIDDRQCKVCDEPSRSVIFDDKDIELKSNVQDEGKTLKLFIESRNNLIEHELESSSYIREHLADSMAFFAKSLKEEAEKSIKKKEDNDLL